jgi:small multidrug resistance family-3 protein
VTVLRSVTLFGVAALTEIGRAWLIWQGVREQRGLLWIGARHPRPRCVQIRRHAPIRPALRPDPGRLRRRFRCRLLAWGVIFDGFHPDLWEVIGAGICLAGVAVIIYAPRAA